MDQKSFIIAFVVSFVLAYLMADRFHKQGYPFWRLLLLGTISAMGIILTVMAVISGKN